MNDDILQVPIPHILSLKGASLCAYIITNSMHPLKGLSSLSGTHLPGFKVGYLQCYGVKRKKTFHFPNRKLCFRLMYVTCRKL